jgi:U3 small nucleolar RNA-associated protein 5
MPDLVARLSSLHATLTARLALQERLLTLSGRLDLVLAQVELQSSRAPASLVPRSGQAKKRRSSGVRQPTRYVEGESTDEDEDEMDVEIEQGSGEDGSEVEEIGLGGPDESDSEADDDEEDEELDGSDVSGSETGNAFIDEAEEDWESDEEEDDDDNDE